jgi:MFS family permease
MNRTVLLTSNMVGVLALSIGALEAFLPIYTVFGLGFTPFHAGLLWGIQIFMTIAVKPAMGMISDRHGRKPLLYWGLWMTVAAFALIPWVEKFFLLMILSGMYGLGRAMVTSSAAALVADISERNHLGSAMGAYGTILDVGHAVGPILSGFLIAFSDGQDFRLSFALISFILIGSALAFNAFVQPQHLVPKTAPSPTDLDE